jgi:NADH dehydrogenase
MILVAGGTGTLGSRLVRRLEERGLQVRILTRDAERAAPVAHGPNVTVAVGDVRDRASVGRAMEGVDVVVSAFHGFAGPRDESPASVDRDGNANIVDSAAEVGAQVVLTSIVGASPDSPVDLFRMKHAAEAHLRESGVPWTIVRATAFFETWIGLLEQTAGRSGRPMVFGRGDNRINFVSADDVAALVERAVTDPATRGRSIDIGGPEDLSFNQLAAAVQTAAGRTGAPRHVPRPMLRAMSVLMRPIKPELARQSQAAVLMDTADMTFDTTSTRASYPELPQTTLSDLLTTHPAVGTGKNSAHR